MGRRKRKNHRLRWTGYKKERVPWISPDQIQAVLILDKVILPLGVSFLIFKIKVLALMILKVIIYLMTVGEYLLIMLLTMTNV